MKLMSIFNLTKILKKKKIRKKIRKKNEKPEYFKSTILHVRVRFLREGS